MVHLNSILTRHEQPPIRIRNWVTEEAEERIDYYEEAINWAMDHSEHTDGSHFADDKYYYFQNRDLTPAEMIELTNVCMKKVHKMIKAEEDFTETEKIPCIKKVAKGLLERDRID